MKKLIANILRFTANKLDKKTQATRVVRKTPKVQATFKTEYEIASENCNRARKAYYKSAAEKQSKEVQQKLFEEWSHLINVRNSI